jgi:hypothetical protein
MGILSLNLRIGAITVVGVTCSGHLSSPNAMFWKGIQEYLSFLLPCAMFYHKLSPKNLLVQNIGVSFRFLSGILRDSITLCFFHHLIFFFFDRFQTMSSSSHNDSAIAVHIPPNKEHTLYDSSIEVMPQAGVLSFFPRRVVSLDKACQSTHMLTPPVFKHITIFSSHSLHFPDRIISFQLSISCLGSLRSRTQHPNDVCTRPCLGAAVQRCC